MGYLMASTWQLLNVIHRLFLIVHLNYYIFLFEKKKNREQACYVPSYRLKIFFFKILNLKSSICPAASLHAFILTYRIMNHNGNAFLITTKKSLFFIYNIKSDKKYPGLKPPYWEKKVLIKNMIRKKKKHLKKDGLEPVTCVLESGLKVI